MSALVELIKKIGIFMIAAQAVIHFAPGQKYEKYLKMIVGIMILLQLLSPLYSISVNAETDWNKQFQKIEEEIAQGMPEGILGEISNAGMGTTTEKVIEELEGEIKTKLNKGIPDENYRVTGVRVSMHVQNDWGKNDSQKYVLEKIRVIVRMGADTGLQKTEGEQSTEKNTQNSTGAIEKIQIPKIAAGGGPEKKEPDETPEDEEQETENSLRKKFCNILGMGEEYMEVSIYGTVEEDNR